MKVVYFMTIFMCWVRSLDWETIQTSVEVGDIEILKDLIQEDEVDTTNDKKDKTALILAIEQGRDSLIQGLIEMKASVNLENVLRSGAKQPLHIASAKGKLDIVKMLIRAKAKINAIADVEYQTPLMQAIHAKSESVVAELIKFKANVNFNDEIAFMWETPLLSALSTSNVNMVKQLIAAKANVDKGNTWFGESPLIIACQRGLSDIAEVLLDSKANFHSTDIRGNTALHFASKNNQAKIVCSLIKSNAPLGITNVRLEKPLEALRAQEAKMVDEFIRELEEANKPAWLK